MFVQRTVAAACGMRASDFQAVSFAVASRCRAADRGSSPVELVFLPPRFQLHRILRCEPDAGGRLHQVSAHFSAQSVSLVRFSVSSTGRAVRFVGARPRVNAYCNADFNPLVASAAGFALPKRFSLTCAAADPGRKLALIAGHGGDRSGSSTGSSARLRTTLAARLSCRALLSDLILRKFCMASCAWP